MTPKTNADEYSGWTGERYVDHAPNGHWMTTTMISYIRAYGSTASMTIDGATCAEVFRAYVEHVLAPTLRPGDIVILDNLSAHRDAEARKRIEAVGAHLCYLPLYSRDFKPIEQTWSRIKEYLRDTKARTQQTLEQAIAHALAKVTPQDARAWFNASGYPTCQT